MGLRGGKLGSPFKSWSEQCSKYRELLAVNAPLPPSGVTFKKSGGNKKNVCLPSWILGKQRDRRLPTFNDCCAHWDSLFRLWVLTIMNHTVLRLWLGFEPAVFPESLPIMNVLESFRKAPEFSMCMIVTLQIANSDIFFFLKALWTKKKKKHCF